MRLAKEVAGSERWRLVPNMNVPLKLNTLTDVFYFKVLENKYPETYKFEGLAYM